MILGIDASNIRGGGGVTHLVELLTAANPEEYGYSKVVVWSKQSTLDRIPSRPWLKKSPLPVFEKSLIPRMIWQRFYLSHLACQVGCDALFVPGGSFAGNFRPFITMSQNLLPFEWKELRRYGWSLFTFKLLLLRFIQSKSFKKANGLIFLTRYAESTVTDIVKKYTGKYTIIPHGINVQFMGDNRLQKSISGYSISNPFRILYVSIVSPYKHQWHVADAVALLRKQRIPVELVLVGPACSKAFKYLQDTLTRVDPLGEYIRYVGPIPHEQLNVQYAHADLCLFASSCENMPNILLEGMASGLPIACSNKGPMPEVLGDAGVYFDPECPDEIAEALLTLINYPELREKLAKRSYSRVQNFSWKRCANETFQFLKDVTLENKLIQSKILNHKEE